MAYNFLDLVNTINRRLNEIELTSTTFPTAVGFYSSAKDSVNAAIRNINQAEFEWPFNHVDQDVTLVPGTVRYAYPADAKTLDLESFRIKRDNILGNATQKLSIISYEEYLDKYVDYEYNSTDEGIRGIPRMVFRTPNQEFGLIPPPKEAYTLAYEYYKLPIELVNYDDVPSLPEQFKYVIVEGAMYYAYIFRGNNQDASLQLGKFEDAIKNMRSIYINRYDYLRDTRVNLGASYGISGPRTI
jgi:hypothetical protein